MSIEMFLERENIQLVWDVLIDEPMIKKICISQNKVNELVSIFENNLKPFYSREKSNSNSLVDLNKKYILLLINYVIKLQTQPVQSTQSSQVSHPPAPTPPNFKKIKIHDDVDTTGQQITYEDIHNERMSKFEKELNRKQEEFTNAISLSVPNLPNFKDELDQPMSEIELEIKRIQEQRNYDIEMINKSHADTNSQNWLSSQETSIKNEKLSFSLTPAKNNPTVANDNSKHITWSNENKFYEPLPVSSLSQLQEENTASLFNKLKKVETTNYQSQIDELKNEVSNLNSKIDTILEKISGIDVNINKND